MKFGQLALYQLMACDEHCVFTIPGLGMQSTQPLDGQVYDVVGGMAGEVGPENANVESISVNKILPWSTFDPSRGVVSLTL